MFYLTEYNTTDIFLEVRDYLDIPHVAVTNDDDEVHYIPYEIGNIITYEADYQLEEVTYADEEGLHVNAFKGSDGNQLTITSHTFSNGVGTIEFNDDVAVITDYAFYGSSDMTSVDLPRSIESIGANSFANCVSLSGIDIPLKTKYILTNAFYGCSGLTEVVIPNRVEQIRDGAFRSCSGMTALTIGEYVTEIGDTAFSGCSGLKNITFHSKTIKPWFSANTSISSITISDKVKIVSSNAFIRCGGLKDVTIEDSSEQLMFNGYCFATLDPFVVPIETMYIGRRYEIPIPSTQYQFGPFSHLSSLKTLTIGENFTNAQYESNPFSESIASLKEVYAYQSRIGVWFSGATSLSSVTIGDKVTTILSSAFSDCSAIKRVNISDLDAWCKITFGSYDANPTYYSKRLYLNGVEVSSVDMPSGITSVNQYVFYGCSGLTSVTIPNSVMSIGSYAFRYCRGLTSVTIGSGTTSIGARAFNGCSGLTNITCAAMTAPTIASNTFQTVKTGGILYVPSGSSGYDVWMQETNYYLGLYGWTKVEQ